MNEFRKPFEYEEDKGVGGYLLLFFLMLLSIEILLGIMAVVQVNDILQSIPWLKVLLLVFGTAYILSILFTCIALHKLTKYAAQIAKIFLIVRGIYLTLSYLMIFKLVYSSNIEVYAKLNSKIDIIISFLIIPLIYIIGFSISWYFYFLKSKRVKQITETDG